MLSHGTQLDFAGFYRRMAGGVSLALAVGAAVLAAHGGAVAALAAAASCSLWLLAPPIAWRISQPPPAAARPSRLSAADAARAAPDRSAHLALLRDLRHGEDNLLPPDNFQEDPRAGGRAPHLADQHRPLPAVDGGGARFRLVRPARPLERLEATLARCSGSSASAATSTTGTTRATCARSSRATSRRWTAATSPHICIALRRCLPRVAEGSARSRVAALEGLRRRARPGARGTGGIPLRPPALDDHARPAGDAPSRISRPVLRPEHPRSRSADSTTCAAAAERASTLVDLVRSAGQRSAVTSATPTLVLLGGSRRAATIDSWRSDLLARRSPPRIIVESRSSSAGRRPRGDARGAAWNSASCSTRSASCSRSAIACTDGTLDPSCYDLLASEARLASFIAIAKGDMPARHWFRLGRTRHADRRAARR